MLVRTCCKLAPFAFALLAAASPAQAAEPPYPTKPVRVIVPYPPGGTTDPTARAFTGWFAEKMGTTFVIDNRPGAGSTLGATDNAETDVSGSGRPWINNGMTIATNDEPPVTAAGGSLVLPTYDRMFRQNTLLRM